MTDTRIEWADRVWNPVTGCTKVSAGCKHCYAEVMAKRTFGRLYRPMLNDGSGQTLDVISTSHHDEYLQNGFARSRRFTDVMTHPDRLDAPLRWRKPGVWSHRRLCPRRLPPRAGREERMKLNDPPSTNEGIEVLRAALAAEREAHERTQTELTGVYADMSQLRLMHAKELAEAQTEAEAMRRERNREIAALVALEDSFEQRIYGALDEAAKDNQRHCDHIAILDAALARADALVRQLEWSFVQTTLRHSAITSVNCCPICRRMLESGHTDDCALAAYLRDREGRAA